MAFGTQEIKQLREMTGAGMMDCKKALTETNGDIEAAATYLREKGIAKAQKKSGRIAAEGLVQVKMRGNDAASLVEVNSETDFVAKNDEFVQFVDELAQLALEREAKSAEELKEADFGGKTAQEALNEKIAKIGENMTLRRADYVTGDAVFSYVHGNGRIASVVALESNAEASELEQLGKDISMQVASMNPKYISTDDVDQDYIASEKEVLLNQALNENKELEAQGKAKPVEIVEKMVMGRLNKELKEVCLLEQPFIKDSAITVGKLVDEKAKELGKDIKVSQIVRYEVGEGLEKKEENFAEEVAKQMA